MRIHIGDYIEIAIEWLSKNLEPFFDTISFVLSSIIENIQAALLWPPFYIIIILLTLAAWRSAGKGVALFTLLGMLLIQGMGLWEETMETLAMVLSSVIVALVVGFPIGIWASGNNRVEAIVRPILDFMQTMPAFVYLIPAVLFFKLGQVPGIVATVIFSMPPSVRLTNLGIRQVPGDVVEAGRAFGCTSRQMLLKVQLPLALSTILAGVNQTIMLALSMVVIAAMIGAGGLGEEVLKGITQLKIGLGFESGIAVVILAIVLDRITQALGNKKT